MLSHTYILEEVVCMRVDGFDDRVEGPDALDATVNQLCKFHFILNY
jgi:hypothetical protein